MVKSFLSRVRAAVSGKVTSQRLEGLGRQIGPFEIAARLRLAALRRLARRWEPEVPTGLQPSLAFGATADRQPLRKAFRDSGLVEPCAREAETVLADTFTLFGGFTLTVPGGLPDWLAGFPGGPRWSDRFAFDIDISGADGRDVRFNWELSRHGDLVALARAAFLTGDSRFVERLEKLLSGWMNANLFLRGPNWTSALEVAVRAVSWSFIHDVAGHLFQDDSLRRRMTDTLFLHGLYIERFLSAGLNPSNHVIGEAAALFVLGGKFESTPEGQRWRARARRILSDELVRQTFECGASREQAIAYHRFVTGLFGLCLALGKPWEFTRRHKDRVRRMYEFLRQVARPDGTFPQLGDGDDAVCLRLREPGANDLSGDLALGAALFPGLPASSQCPSPEVLWLFGPSSCAHPVPRVSKRESVLFPGPGLAVLESPDAKLQVEFDCGPQGCTPVSSHGHADALSVTVWRGGDRLIDAGTYRYNGADTWRNAFRSTAFHNTITVDGLSQAVPMSPFRWFTLADAHGAASFFSGDLDWVMGALPPGPERPWSHSRDVVRLGSSVLVVIDTVSCRGKHRLNAHFHCGRAKALARGRRGEVEFPDGSTMSLFAANPCVTVSAIESSVLPMPAWRSRHYGDKEPSSTLVCEAEFSDSIVLPWVISFDADAVKKSPAAVRAGYAAELSVEGKRYLLAVPPKMDVVHVNALRFVGRWALVELSRGKFSRAWAADAWALEFAGNRLFTRFGGQSFAIIGAPVNGAGSTDTEPK